MNTIKVSLDRDVFWSKPTGQQAAIISDRIAGSSKSLKLREIAEFTEKVSVDGHTFCPATFKNGKRSKENFEQQQLFALDFDNKDPDRTVSFEKVKARAEKYNLPILFAYDTFSSTEHNKFRVVFLNDSSITNIKVAEAMQLAMGTIFPESDSSCYKDISRMYYGGKERRYYDRTIPTINVESVFRGMTYYLKDTSEKHLKDRLRRFSQESGIALNKNGFLDIMVIDDPTEINGASHSTTNGENSPNPIIYIPNIIGNGEISPNKYYCIKLIDSTSKSSVVTSERRTYVTHNEDKKNKNHKNYRRSVIDKMPGVCKLFREFVSGSRNLSHDELFGLLNNLINVESGIAVFREIQLKHPELYDDDRRTEWDRHIFYNKKNEYKPSRCGNYCPYRDKCRHGRNILTTVHPKRGTVEKDANFQEKYYPLEEAERDMRMAIDTVFRTRDGRSHIINAPCAIGKTTATLDIVREKGIKFSYAGPTVRLETQIYDDALSLGLDVCKTPSLEQIAYDLPADVRKQVRMYYMGGQPHLVHPYLEEVIASRNIPCLAEYMKERFLTQRSNGSIITTHRYMMNMDGKRLKTYDFNIIDEDLIYKSYITNQCSILISDLREELSRIRRFLLPKQQDEQMFAKGQELLRRCRNETYIHMDAFKWSYPKQKDSPFDDTFMKVRAFDHAAFCSTEHFYVRRASENIGMKEDTIVFIKPFVLNPANYIMLSATASETICRKFFGKNIVFHNCKQVEYKGNLYQFPGRSMSRSSIANNEGIVRRIMQKMGCSERNTITFANQEIGMMHFGNTEGLNTLEGKNLLVIGTPYHPEFLYKLVAHNLGFVFDENEEMSPQYISHNGYKTWFTTFRDENLRAVHFWMVESELEQAVGRARLPRHNCNVYVFSNFPLKQAKMVEDFDYGKE